MADLKDDESDDGLSSVADFVQIYMIKIDIIGAHNIEKADTFGKSDPFCKISAFSTSYTTCTIRKTLNPVWNERVDMTFFNDPKQLKFELFDYDGNTKDDAIGDCFFTLDPNIYSPTNNGYSGRIKLQNCKSGELEIKVFARKLLPLEIERRLSQLHHQIETNNNNIKQLDGSINDINQKNAILQNDINMITSDITNTTDNISKKELQLKDTEREGQRLNEEQSKTEEENNELDKECNDLETINKELMKKLEDIKIAEDKKRTENERLTEDLESLEKQIKEIKERKKREEREREEREDREKQKLKEDLPKEKEVDEEEEEEIPIKPTPRGDDDDKKPLVSKGHSIQKEKSDCCVVL